MSPEPSDELPRARPITRLRDFLFERLGLDAAAALAAKKRVPMHGTSLFYFLGGMALFLFGVQVVTGILLALYYKPSPDQAFESVRAIMSEIPFGWLFRSIHSWSANLLIGVIFLHLLTTYIMRAYRRPREFTWITGFLLLAFFMAFGFSGYLLPWNQLAFFATRVGTAIAGVVPVIGPYLLLTARSGENVTGDTLARFYALHVVILPLATLGLIGVHLFLVQKHGMSVPSRVAERHGGEDRVPSVRFVPDFLLRDMVGWYLAIGLLAALAAWFPWELGQKADPFGAAPEGIKPEWYFLFMFQALKHLPAHLFGYEWLEGEVVGVLFFGFCGLLVLVVPLMDFDNLGPRVRRLWNAATGLIAGFLAAVVFWFVLQAVGALVIYLFRRYGNELEPESLQSLAWWLQYVAFPACFGLIMLLIAFLTLKRPQRQPRLNVNVMGALAVLFFIVMTAWGLLE